ncbi:MAG: ComEC family competence protein [Flavobacteriaceae bacterium]|nr:ComEC family competence protein [Bacteroidia bacterium]NNF74494.1 ComEC family competence protein [Flavobacteriaceae bacterium]
MLQFNILDYPVVRITTFLILGIVLNGNFDTGIFTLLVTILGSTCILIVVNAWLKTKIRRYIGPDFLLYIIIVFLGMALAQIHDHRHNSGHYTHFVKNTDSLYSLVFQVYRTLKPSQYQDKYIVGIQSIQGRNHSGRLLVNIDKDSLFEPLKVDDIIYTKAKIEPIARPINPHQFDYRLYMSRQNIYHQLKLKRPSVKIAGQANSILGYADNLRESIRKALETYSISSDEWAVMNAMLLGQRQELSENLYERYAQSGAIHILAISGLHIGIILIMLQFILKPLEKIPFGGFVKLIFILALLWSYAIIAGLSASVMRACCMFSIIALALNMKRQSHIINTLFISIFVLLLINPNYIYDVGFQLSYSAVFAIVTLEPIIRKIWRPAYYPLTYFWRTLTVTLSAQIGVLPLSLYYFHQFPGLFLLSNMVIIPALTFILAFGFLIIGLALLEILPTEIMHLYEAVIRLLNDFIGWISDKDEYVFEQLSFSTEKVILYYFLLLMMIWTWYSRNTRLILIALMGIVFFQGYRFLDYSKASDQTLIVFHRSRFSMIGLHTHQSLQVYHSRKDNPILEDQALLNYKVGENIKQINLDSMPDVLQTGKLKILIIDSMGIYNLHAFKPDVVYLRDSPRLNLSRLIDSVQPSMILWDGSNYTSYQKRWAASCRAKKIPFHQTREKGAFIYRYSTIHR